MISDYYNKTFTIYRMVWTDSKSSLSSVGTFVGHKQRTIAEISESLGISFTKSYTIWCAIDTDVKEQDTIKDEFGKYYSVKALSEKDYGDSQHLQLIAEQDLDYVSI